MYVRPPVWVYKNAASSFNVTNRGDYPAPIDIRIEVPAGAANSAAYVMVTMGGSQMKLLVPQSATKAQVLRYSGGYKVVTLEVDSVESLRMDLMTFIGDAIHPRVPPGTTAAVWTPSGLTSLGSGTRIMYSESFA
jgi:hypothetical protein